MFYIVPRLRTTDKHGSGAFGAPRKGGRTHNGVDYAAKPGTPIFAALPGRITKLGYPYRGNRELRYVELQHKDDRIRYMYVEPYVDVGQVVVKGDLLGYVQKLPYKGITQHVHVEVRETVNTRRRIVDPTEYFEKLR